MIHKIKALILALIIGICFSQSAKAGNDRWYDKHYEFAHSIGILSDEEFVKLDGDEKVNRSEIAKLFSLYMNGKGSTGNNKFTDLSEDKNIPYINYLSDLGIIVGYPDKTYRPNNTITREELSMILYRIGKTQNILNESLLGTLNDIENSYARKEISVLVGNGIIKGYEDGSFRLKNKPTRGEILSTIQNLYELKNGKIKTVPRELTTRTERTKSNYYFFFDLLADDYRYENSNRIRQLRTQLERLIRHGKSLDSEDYTKESYENLKSGIRRGEQVLNRYFGERDLMDSINELRYLIENLVEVPTVIAPVEDNTDDEEPGEDEDEPGEGDDEEPGDDDEEPGDVTVLKEFIVLNTKNSLMEKFAFAAFSSSEEEIEDFKIFVNNERILEGYEIKTNTSNNQKEIYFNEDTFKEAGTYTIRLEGDGYLTKEVDINLTNNKVKLKVKQPTMVTKMNSIIVWDDNSLKFKEMYMQTPIEVLVNNIAVSSSINPETLEIEVDGNVFSKEGSYNIVIRKNGFEDVQLRQIVSEVDKVDVVSSETDKKPFDKKYEVGDTINYDDIEIKIELKNKEKVVIKEKDLSKWGLEISPENGHILDKAGKTNIKIFNGKVYYKKEIEVKGKKFEIENRQINKGEALVIKTDDISSQIEELIIKGGKKDKEKKTLIKGRDYQLSSNKKEIIVLGNFFNEEKNYSIEVSAKGYEGKTFEIEVKNVKTKRFKVSKTTIKKEKELKIITEDVSSKLKNLNIIGGREDKELKTLKEGDHYKLSSSKNEITIKGKFFSNKNKNYIIKISANDYETETFIIRVVD